MFNFFSLFNLQDENGALFVKVLWDFQILHKFNS